MELKLYNQSGSEVGNVKLPDAIFGIKVKHDLVHEVVVAARANARENLAHAKDRSEVRGGGKKPWRQKGTGRARHASIRSPLWRKGGATFGPRSTDIFSKKVNKKVKQKALFMALSSKVIDNQILMLDKLTLDSYKTKAAVTIIKALQGLMTGFNPKKKESILIITVKKDRNLERAAGNIPNIDILPADSLNASAILTNKYAVVCADAVGVIEKTYKA